MRSYGDGVDGARERHLRAMMIVVAGHHQRSAVHGADYHGSYGGSYGDIA